MAHTIFEATQLSQALKVAELVQGCYDFDAAGLANVEKRNLVI